MSSVRGQSASSSSFGRFSLIESLEARQLFAVARPDHIVVVIQQDRASDAIGNPIWSYLNQVASTGLVYTNSHGVTHPSTPNSLAIFSGSTQGITDNGRNHSFGGANLARSLFNAGLSFSGYAENLPSDGSQVTQAGNGIYNDLYTRNINPMAQFTDYGIDPATGLPRPNSTVNRTFGAFTAFPTNDYSNLPTVSFIIANNLHNAHGSNEQEPWAGSPDEENNDILRKGADDWLRANIDAYLQWAKLNNSLLIITQDEERWTGGTAQTVTTVVNGDADLFNPGTNSDNINHYNLLRTITDMYGLAPLGVTGGSAALDTDVTGQLSPDMTTPPTQVGTSTSLSSSVGGSGTFGQSITFTATVTPASGSTAPGGIVTFKNGTTTIGTGTLNAAGVATLTLSNLGVGSHSITAVYGGSTGFTGSTSTALALNILKASSSTSLTTSLASSVFGQSVTLTATTTGQGGTVTFMDGTTSLGTVNVDSTGKATMNIASLSVGSHSITAVYNGGTNHDGSTSAAKGLTVAKAGASVGVTSSANPAAVGQPVTFTATVQSAVSGAGVPTGTVQFLINGVAYGLPVPLVNGVATSTPNSSLAVGSYTITAEYSGSTNHAVATSAGLTQQVAASAPANNNFANRITLAGDVVVTTGTNAQATKELLEPKHGSNAGGKSVWWTWTAPAAGTVTIDTFGSNFNTLLGVYTGSSVLTLSKVASNNDSGGSQSKVSFSAVAGRTYQIAVDGHNGAAGNVTLRIHMSAKQPTGVTASDGTFSDGVAVSWSAAVGASTYEVWRNTRNSTSGAVKLGEVAVTTFSDTTANPGTTYWYFVRAKNAVSTSSYSTGNSGYRSTAAAAKTSGSSGSSSPTSSLFSSTPILLDEVATR